MDLIDNGESTLILIAVGVLAYVLYKAYNGITGLGSAAIKAGGAAVAAVSNAAQQVVASVSAQTSRDYSYVVPGTGMTILELANIGYTSDQIVALIQQSGCYPPPYGQCSD